jgi:hypothetical protein
VVTSDVDWVSLLNGQDITRLSLLMSLPRTFSTGCIVFVILANKRTASSGLRMHPETEANTPFKSIPLHLLLRGQKGKSMDFHDAQ